MEFNSNTSDYVNGLYVKDGRLINARPDGVSGIEEAAMYRKQMKKQYKIDCIAAEFKDWEVSW